jgi:hypothetical protein
VLRIIQKTSEQHLVLELPDGSHLSVPISWTDQAQTSEHVSEDSSDLILSLEGLHQIALLIQRKKQQSPSLPPP